MTGNTSQTDGEQDDDQQDDGMAPEWLTQVTGSLQTLLNPLAERLAAVEARLPAPQQQPAQEPAAPQQPAQQPAQQLGVPTIDVQALAEALAGPLVAKVRETNPPPEPKTRKPLFHK